MMQQLHCDSRSTRRSNNDAPADEEEEDDEQPSSSSSGDEDEEDEDLNKDNKNDYKKAVILPVNILIPHKDFCCTLEQSPSALNATRRNCMSLKRHMASQQGSSSQMRQLQPLSGNCTNTWPLQQEADEEG